MPVASRKRSQPVRAQVLSSASVRRCRDRVEPDRDVCRRRGVVGERAHAAQRRRGRARPRASADEQEPVAALRPPGCRGATPTRAPGEPRAAPCRCPPNRASAVLTSPCRHVEGGQPQGALERPISGWSRTGCGPRTPKICATWKQAELPTVLTKSNGEGETARARTCDTSTSSGDLQIAATGGEVRRRFRAAAVRPFDAAARADQRKLDEAADATHGGRRSPPAQRSAFRRRGSPATVAAVSLPWRRCASWAPSRPLEMTSEVLLPPKPNEFSMKRPSVIDRSAWFRTTPSAAGSAPIPGVADQEAHARWRDRTETSSVRPQAPSVWPMNGLRAHRSAASSRRYAERRQPPLHRSRAWLRAVGLTAVIAEAGSAASARACSITVATEDPSVFAATTLLWVSQRFAPPRT